MKKIIILMLAILGFNCRGEDEYIIPPKASIPPYDLGFIVDLKKVKDPEVKYIKVAVKNIDKIFPKYKVRVDFPIYVDVHYDGWRDTYFMILQRRAETIDGKTYYFGDIDVLFNSEPDPVRYTVNKDRIFELKIYKNDDLFLTKKITLRSNRDPRLKDGFGWVEDDPDYLFFVGYTDKVEVDNRDYVKEINVGDRKGRALIIEIPDKPIKK